MPLVVIGKREFALPKIDSSNKLKICKFVSTRTVGAKKSLLINLENLFTLFLLVNIIVSQ